MYLLTKKRELDKCVGVKRVVVWVLTVTSTGRIYVIMC